MIEDYLSQRMTVRRRTGISFNGDPIFAETRNVPCRWEQSRRMVRNAQGEEVVSESLVHTTVTVATGDELVDVSGRAWPVVSTATHVDLDGDAALVEVSL